MCAQERSKPTPGPWEALERDGFLQVIAAPNADHWCKSVVLYDPATDSEATGVPADEMRANARLIALAPDMLAALRELVALYDIPRDAADFADGFNELADGTARAILAQVDGKE